MRQFFVNMFSQVTFYWEKRLTMHVCAAP
ncbi:hypothetical protein R2601_20806 [Salipiger bermudensis HTCC2601]|uniref:Uncharacterized protein n=1 Tax=Salipiger bermudensis (strain DSM 26914 / JCM 13377 / KCTC 12554 / HTCC2601) TaxID=314265 RepID=Q0FT78_SALBH|nr:hypothetical protein R2601_20806 [Salipiger bermudensis HTCC2601]